MVLIGTAGYAGLLAIWGWVNPFLLRWQVLAIGALLGASLLMFLAFQLIGNRSRRIHRPPLSLPSA
jgi:hypothetical protein